MTDRLVIRCSVYDDDALVEIIEQGVTRAELGYVLRRAHFLWRFESAMSNGRRVVFESIPDAARRGERGGGHERPSDKC